MRFFFFMTISSLRRLFLVLSWNSFQNTFFLCSHSSFSTSLSIFCLCVWRCEDKHRRELHQLCSVCLRKKLCNRATACPFLHLRPQRSRARCRRSSVWQSISRRCHAKKFIDLSRSPSTGCSANFKLSLVVCPAESVFETWTV